MIPLLNLKKQYESIRQEILDSISAVLESGTFVLGPRVKEFEDQVASYMGMPYALGVASGTDALHLAIKALGIGRGDEVITTPFTFFATIEAIIYEGARPVLVDIDPDTFNIDTAQIEACITPSTKGIIPVHMFGHPADMREILRIADKHSLIVIEDCAQSFGATLDGKQTGSFGDAGCFSFYPSKNLGAYGDAGIVTVVEEEIASDIVKFRNHGSAGNYLHADVGFNSRLDEIQAAILLVKMKHIDRYNEIRRERAAQYTKLLSPYVKTPVEKEGARHVYHQYTIRHPERDRIRQALADAEISSTVYYPIPAHLQPALESLGYGAGSFPVAEESSRTVLSLPICPELEESTVQRVADVIAGAC